MSNVQRLGLGGASAIAVAGMALAPMLSAAPAVAAPYNTNGDGTPGTITINKGTGDGIENKTTVKYKVYKLFIADVPVGSKTGEQVKVSAVDWASDSAKSVVEATIKAYDPSYTGTTPQEAAEFIGGNMNANPTGAHIQPGEHAQSGSFAEKLAAALKAGVTPETSTVSDDGAPVSFADGYYFLTSDDGENGNTDTAASAPIFAAIGGDPITVTEKSAYPTVTKQIYEDGRPDTQLIDGTHIDGTQAKWGDVADSSRNQAVSYRLDGTMSAEIGTYNTYKYVFHDTISKGLTCDRNSVHVTLYADGDTTGAGKDITQAANITLTPKTLDSKITDTEYDANSSKLTVSYDDLKKVASDAGAPLTAKSIIRVTYTASLNQDAIIASTGNPNVVYLEYSNNPQGTGTGFSPTDEVHDFAYAIHLNKVDKQTGLDLKGAVFQIKNSSGKFIQADGSESDDPHNFETDDAGMIVVPCVDADVYTITEITAPANYQETSEFSVFINPTYDETAQTITKIDSADSKSVTKSVDHGNNVLHGIHAGNGLLTDADTASYSTQLANGEVDLTLTNDKNVLLPITGQQGIALAVIAGVGLVIVAIVGLKRRNSRDED